MRVCDDCGMIEHHRDDCTLTGGCADCDAVVGQRCKDGCPWSPRYAGKSDVPFLAEFEDRRELFAVGMIAGVMLCGIVLLLWRAISG